MNTRSERDRQKAVQEKNQAILSLLLKDEDNKYCVDCDAKGPRWASWNLGIFLCIRCAGIHRNLGVHISKVRSVNLDSWTPEQVAMMQEMGNSRARAVYEAHLPDHFRRPQTDSSLEAFIRAKYEQKKYTPSEWVPPKPKLPPADNVERTDKKRPRPKPTTHVPPISDPNKTSSSKPANRKSTAPKAAVPNPVKLPSQDHVKKASEPMPDLLSLNLESNGVQESGDLFTISDPAPAPSSDMNNIFGEFMSHTPSSPVANTSQSPEQSLSPTTPTGNVSSSGAADIGELMGESTGEKKSTKESIMSLFGNASSQQQPQMFGVPGGMYMPQQQMPIPNGMAQQQMPMQNGMAQQQMPMQNGMPQQQMPIQNGMQHNNIGMVQQQQVKSFNTPNLMAIDPLQDLQRSLQQGNQLSEPVHDVGCVGTIPQSQGMMSASGSISASASFMSMPPTISQSNQSTQPTPSDFYQTNWPLQTNQLFTGPNTLAMSSNQQSTTVSTDFKDKTKQEFLPASQTGCQLEMNNVQQQMPMANDPNMGMMFWPGNMMMNNTMPQQQMNPQQMMMPGMTQAMFSNMYSAQQMQTLQNQMSNMNMGQTTAMGTGYQQSPMMGTNMMAGNWAAGQSQQAPAASGQTLSTNLWQ